jgi:glycosyltransferase involved in cell wall biosynthesis
MLSNLPTVSVAIASYNYGRYLADAIESALNQKGVELEVVVVDDGSSDNSVEIAEDIARRDSRVSVVHHAHNRGHIATFNEALSLGTGEFLVKLDSDDMLTPGSLQRSARVLASHPNVGFVYGNPLEFETVPPPARANGPGAAVVWKGRRWIRLRCLRGDNVIMQPEAMMRASVFRATDGHRSHLPATHDLNLWLRMADIADVARVSGVDQGYYRVHSDSLLQSSFGSYLSDLMGRRAAFEDYFATLGNVRRCDPEIQGWRRRVRLRLSHHALVYAHRVRSGAMPGDDPLPYIEFACETSGRSYGSFDIALTYRPEWYYRLGDKVRWRWWRRFGT